MNLKVPMQLLCVGVLLVSYTNIVNCQSYDPGKEDCRKYCFEDCNKYDANPPSVWVWGFSARAASRNAHEKTDCILAQRHCICETRVSWKNPLVLLGCIAVGLMLLYAIYRVYRKCRSESYQHGWQSTSNSGISNPAACQSNANGNFGTFPGHSVAPNYMQTGYQSSTFPSDAPPEYMPPPSYFECANDSTATTNKLRSN